MHHFAVARLPAAAVQTGPETGSAAWCAHADASGYHQRPVAVHQDTQAAGLTRARVHQLRQVLGANLRMQPHEVCRDTAASKPAAAPTRSDRHQSHNQRGRCGAEANCLLRHRR